MERSYTIQGIVISQSRNCATEGVNHSAHILSIVEQANVYSFKLSIHQLHRDLIHTLYSTGDTVNTKLSLCLILYSLMQISLVFFNAISLV